ncbi:MBL fold metallo-hydrolase [Bradymonas sediminis]|nr:MBL fold metallo-hydrolase [Bradymonas sediminis]TDP71967.1 glyoxylase-like metal-dependent hydrolase (beta-lactamase superfamily II) [Bradymonas sediminis]
MKNRTLPTRLTPLMEARFGLDGGAMFGIIPRPLWERTNPADAQNRIDMACRCLLVEYPDRNVLVDCGIGSKWSQKERGIYNINAQDTALTEALNARGLSPADIDDVILTHLHFDHVGGASEFAGEGDAQRVRATFANARHWVQRRNWAWANGPSARDGGSYRPIDFTFFETQADAPPLELVDGIAEIMPGIEVLPMHGHTFGMQVLKITTAEHTFAYVADLIPTTSHMRDPYVMGYDIQPLVTVEEKRGLLYEASRNDWILIFGHDPSTSFARVELDKRGRPSAVPLDIDF